MFDAISTTTDAYQESHYRPEDKVDPVFREPAFFDAHLLHEVEVGIALGALSLILASFAASVAGRAFLFHILEEGVRAGVAGQHVAADIASGGAQLAGLVLF